MNSIRKIKRADKKSLTLENILHIPKFNKIFSKPNYTDCNIQNIDTNINFQNENILDSKIGMNLKSMLKDFIESLGEIIETNNTTEKEHILVNCIQKNPSNTIFNQSKSINLEKSSSIVSSVFDQEIVKNKESLKNKYYSSVSRKSSRKKNKNCEVEFPDEEFRHVERMNKVQDSLTDEEELNYLIDMHSRWIIMPESDFKYYWDLIVMSITVYSLIFTPFYIAFNIELVYFIKVLESIFDSIFIADLILNFFTSIRDFEERLILNHSIIIKKYLRKWFFFDLISSLPGNIITNMLEIENKLNLQRNYFFFSIVRLAKLFKLAKLLFKEENFSDENKINLAEELNIRSGLKRLIVFLSWFLIFSHILCCIWIFIGQLRSHNWIMNYLGPTNKKIEIYVSSIYYIWTTIFTVGYGDIVAQNIYESIFSILIMGLGVFIYTFTLSSVSSLVSTYDAITEKFYNNLEIAEQIRLKNDLSDDLNDRVLKFLKYDYKISKSKQFSFISDLPARTKNNLLNSIFRKMIDNYSFFKYSRKLNNRDFNSSVLLNLRPYKLFKGEYIIRKGDKIQEMILINQGSLVAEAEFMKIIMRVFELRRNDYFGDIFVLSNKPCPIDLRVKSRFVELYMIKKTDLIKLKQDYPEIVQKIIAVSNENLKRVSKKLRELKNLEKKFNRERMQLFKGNNNNHKNKTGPEKYSKFNFTQNLPPLINTIFSNNKKPSSLLLEDKKLSPRDSIINEKKGIDFNLNYNQEVNSQPNLNFLPQTSHENKNFQFIDKYIVIQNFEINQTENFSIFSKLKIGKCEYCQNIMSSKTPSQKSLYSDRYLLTTKTINENKIIKSVNQFEKSRFAESKNKKARIMDEIEMHVEENKIIENTPEIYLNSQMNKIEKKIIGTDESIEVTKSLTKLNKILSLFKNKKKKKFEDNFDLDI